MKVGEVRNAMESFLAYEPSVHPALRLAEFAMSSLEKTTPESPEEIAFQWFNTLAGIMTWAMEPLLDNDALAGITSDADMAETYGFPSLYYEYSEPNTGREFPNVAELCSFLRNAFAHGNVEILHGGWATYADRTHIRIQMGVPFVAIAVWNQAKGSSKRTKRLILDIRDMVDLVQGCVALCRDQTLWKASALAWSGSSVTKEFGHRPANSGVTFTSGKQTAVEEEVDATD